MKTPNVTKLYMYPTKLYINDPSVGPMSRPIPLPIYM